jgi:hypothetical protein
VLVQREMDIWRSPLASIPRFSATKSGTPRLNAGEGTGQRLKLQLVSKRRSGLGGSRSRRRLSDHHLPLGPICDLQGQRGLRAFILSAVLSEAQKVKPTRISTALFLGQPGPEIQAVSELNLL